MGSYGKSIPKELSRQEIQKSLYLSRKKTEKEFLTSVFH